MKSKFKEYRMFLLCIILFIVFIGLSLYYFMTKDMTRFIMMIIFSFVALTLMLGRFNIILFDDCMIIYEWKIAALLPVVVNYPDIQTIQKKSKHHVVINHKKKANVYVLNSDEFIKKYNEIINKNLKNEKN